MGKRRSLKVQRRLNIKKRNGFTHQDIRKKCRLDVSFLLIEDRHFQDIKSRIKNREFRKKSVRMNVQQIWERRKVLRYLWLWVRGSKNDSQMLVRFLGLDFHHVKSKTHFVCKLGDIVSLDKTEIRENAWKLEYLK